VRKLHWTAKISVFLSFWLIFWLFWFAVSASMTKKMFFYESRQSFITQQLTGEVIKSVEDTTRGKSGSFFGERKYITHGWTYSFTYKYNGKEYVGKSYAKPPKLYFEGDKATVLIDPKYPEVSQLEYTSNVVIPPIAEVIFTLVTGGIFFILACSAVRRIRTLKNGKMSVAFVDKHNEKLNFRNVSKKPEWFKLRYRNKDRVRIVHDKHNDDRFYPLPSIAAKLEESGLIWRSSISMTFIKLTTIVVILYMPFVL
jgi:hypothetical protein